jgi:hypothetical protein
VTKRISILAICAVLAIATAAFAHEHQVRGTVSMAASDHLMIKTVNGKEATIKIVKTTKVTDLDKKTVKPESIAAGSRVIVTTVSDENPYTAMSIEVGVAPKK